MGLIGFAIGIERLLELIKIENQENNQVLYIGAMCEEAIDKVFKTVAEKRKTIKVLTDYKVRSFSKHLNNGQKQGATIIALMGENEIKNGTIWIKDLISKEEQNIQLDKF